VESQEILVELVPSIGTVSADMFAVVVFMSIATTLVAPPVLVQLYRGRTQLTDAVESS